MGFGRAVPATSTPCDEHDGRCQSQRGRNDPYHRHGSCHGGHGRPVRRPRKPRLASGTFLNTRPTWRYRSTWRQARPTEQRRGPAGLPLHPAIPSATSPRSTPLQRVQTGFHRAHQPNTVATRHGSGVARSVRSGWGYPPRLGRCSDHVRRRRRYVRRHVRCVNSRGDSNVRRPASCRYATATCHPCRRRSFARYRRSAWSTRVGYRRARQLASRRPRPPGVDSRYIPEHSPRRVSLSLVTAHADLCGRGSDRRVVTTTPAVPHGRILKCCAAIAPAPIACIPVLVWRHSRQHDRVVWSRCER
jgi:hypothetical protein